LTLDTSLVFFEFLLCDANAALALEREREKDAAARLVAV
jgi:hypothetical protein